MLALALAGVSCRGIADACGVSKSTAAAVVRRELRARAAEQAAAPAARALAVELEADRLDAAHRAVWPAAIAGDLEAVDQVLRLMERRARLLRLDYHPAPTPAGHAAAFTVEVVHRPDPPAAASSSTARLDDAAVAGALVVELLLTSSSGTVAP